MGNGHGPMCEPIHHDGRGYCLTKSWSSSGDWIEIYTDDAPDSPTSPTNWVSLPAEVAPKVAAVIVRRYLREHPISDEWGDTNVIMADILDDIISGEVGIT